MKKISILGSTGSIGVQALDVIRANPDLYKVTALAAGQNLELLKKQAEEFSPSLVCLSDASRYKEAKSVLPKTAEVICGDDALVAAATDAQSDIVLAAVVGMCGLPAVIAALSAGKDVALANKESLVAGGKLVTDTAKKYGAAIYPVDSEHSAVWQTLSAGKKDEVKRIILTASGGPFLDYPADKLHAVTPSDAVKHPTWAMGQKISVDSATMMNKALEIIEARYLFDIENIDYIIHPESVIHSLTEFVDGSVLAQMSYPDMRIPIALALSYPDRLPYNAKKWDFGTNLTFRQPDEQKFPLPKLAKDVLKVGGITPAVFNAANEAAVGLFLDGKIAFTDIQKIVFETTDKYERKTDPTLREIEFAHKSVINRINRDYN